MTHGERRVAQRLESHLSEDCLAWYDIPVGRHYRHPDFVIIDPSLGFTFLEVKDWRLSTLRHADPQTVILETDQGQSSSETRWYRSGNIPVPPPRCYLRPRAYSRKRGNTAVSATSPGPYGPLRITARLG